MPEDIYDPESVSTSTTAAAGCGCDELLFSLDYAERLSAAYPSTSFWYLEDTSSLSFPESLLEGDSHSDYPLRLCLAKSACYALTVSSVVSDSALLCGDSGSDGPPVYALSVDGVARQDGCVVDSVRASESLWFGNCGDAIAQSWERNGGFEPRPCESEGGVRRGQPVITTVIIAACVVFGAIGCAKGRPGRRRGRAQSASAAGADSSGEGSQQQSVPNHDTQDVRKQFIMENLLTKKLSGEDLTSDDDTFIDNDTRSSMSLSVSSMSLGVSRERAGSITSTIPSAGLEMPQSDEESAKNLDEMCGICLEEYSKDDIVCSSCNPKCVHQFHAKCMSEWLVKHEECPNCRLKYLDKPDGV